MTRFRKSILFLALAAGLAVPVGYFVGDRLNWGQRPFGKVPALEGRTLKSVVAEIGAPDAQTEFAMGEATIGEFRIELYNTYPPDHAETRHVRIRELIWHRTGYHVAVWLHQVNGEWVVLDTCRWKEGIVF
jgi:hypothetical protein